MANENKKKSIFLIGITVCVLALLILPWQLPSSKMAIYRTYDANRLRNFALSFRMYSENQFPPSLVEFANGGGFSPGRGYICPSQPERTITIDDIAKGNIDYVYVAAGLTTKGNTPSVTENGRITSEQWLKDNPNATRTVVMHTKPDLLGKWVNFLFLDGHVEGVETSNPEKAAKEKGWIYNAESSASHEANDKEQQ